MSKRKLMAAGAIDGRSRPPFIFRDEFTDDRAAGAVNGTKSTDGKATRTVVDTEGKLSISGGKLVFSGGKGTPVDGDPALWLSAISRSSGIAGFIKVIHSSGIANFGFDTNATGLNAEAIQFSTTNLKIISSAQASFTVDAISYGIEYTIMIILRSPGTFYFVKGGGFAKWTLVYITVANSSATMYPGISNLSGIFSADYLKVAQLPAPFNSDYGLATQRLAGARSAGDAFTHEADCLIELTVTTLSSDYAALRFRELDTTNNYWWIEIRSDGGITLFEKVSGTNTSRGVASAGSIANGQRIVVSADGSTIRVFANNVLKITYSSAENFKTKTTGRISVLGTGGAVSDIVTWPRYLPSNLAAILDRYTK